jgi:hypothetical protein
MEQSEFSFEDKVRRYEAACGSLTDSYPWDFEAKYKGRTCNDMLEQNLLLKTDGTFECDYSMGASKEYLWFYWKGVGKFFYNSKERKLILEADKFELTTCGDWKEEKFNPTILECVEKTFKKIEISDFFWGVKEFYLPWYIINKINDDNYDFLNPELSFYLLEVDFYCENLRAKLDMVENVSKLSGSALTSISEPLKFGDSLTLNPDKTLSLYISNSSYDRDGPYNWNSSFSCKGTWEYSDSREITLRFYSFSIDDGKQLSEAEINNFKLPTEAKTQNFFFEATNFIKCVSANWNWAKFTGAVISELKK